MGENTRAMLEASHLAALRADPSFEWFRGLMLEQYTRAVRRALSQDGENREFLVGRVAGVKDVIDILDDVDARLRRELGGEGGY